MRRMTRTTLLDFGTLFFVLLSIAICAYGAYLVRTAVRALDAAVTESK